MRGWIALPFVFVIGLLVGGLGPRQQLQRDRAELERLRKAVRSQPERPTQFGGVVDFLRIGGTGRSGTNRGSRVRSGAGGTGALERASVSGSNTADVGAQGWVGATGGPPVSMKERIEQAAEVWRIRSDIARANFVRSAQLDPEATTKFDVLVEAMNLRLRERISTWTESFKTNAQSLNPETGVRVVNDLSNVMVLTYDEMDRTLPSGWREKAGSDFDLGSFIDPTVATPLVEVEGQFREVGRARRRRAGASDSDWDGPHGGAPFGPDR